MFECCSNYKKPCLWVSCQENPFNIIQPNGPHVFSFLETVEVGKIRRIPLELEINYKKWCFRSFRFNFSKTHLGGSNGRLGQWQDEKLPAPGHSTSCLEAGTNWWRNGTATARRIVVNVGRGIMPQNDPPNFGEWFSEWSSPGKGRELKSPGPKPPVNQWLKGWEPPNVDGLHQERAKKSKVILIFQSWSSFSPLFDVHFGGKHQHTSAPAHQHTKLSSSAL